MTALRTAEPADRWAILAWVAVGQWLAISPWLGSSAVAPQLAHEWGASSLDLTLLTIAVQLGFAVGAFALAASGAADVVDARILLAAGATVAAIANLGFAGLAHDVVGAMPFRVITGMGLAAVYPVCVKVLSGWFRAGRGLAIGILIAAITVGSAMPYLFRAVGALAGADWRPIVASASAAGLLGGVMLWLGARPGPYEVASSRFSLEHAATAYREPAVRLAVLGYLGHMWELYAMWTWVPAFLVASLATAGISRPGLAEGAAFVVVAAGGIGCAFAGALADRLGRTTLTIGAMVASGSSALAIGWLFGGPPAIVLALAIVWGVTVVADSAQFSVAVTELAPAGTAGSALSAQLGAGFVLTGVTILLVGALDPGDGSGWRVAFGLLAIGPAVGVLSMWRLRRRPEAMRMAAGHR